VTRASLLLLCALVVVACSEEGPDPSGTFLPIQLNSSTPPDSTVEAFDPLNDFAMTAVMNRNLDAIALRQNWIVPLPTRPGDFVASGRRQLQWTGIGFDPDVPVYTWFLDGPEFVEPIVLRFWTGSPGANTGVIRGGVRIVDGLRSARHAMLFLLSLSSRGEALSEEALSFLGLPVERVKRLGGLQEIDENTTPDELISRFEFGELVPDRTYILLAIEDTDGDGYYVPQVDWWGYPHEPGNPDEPLPIVALSPDGPDPLDLNASFVIDRPGAFDPEDF